MTGNGGGAKSQKKYKSVFVDDFVHFFHAYAGYLSMEIDRDPNLTI